MRLAILHIAGVFGGAERTTANLLAHLDRNRIAEVVVLSKAPLKAHFAHADRFVDLGQDGLNGWFADGTQALRRDARIVAERLREVRPDCVLAMMHYGSALLALARFYGLRTRAVVSFRGPVYEHMRHFEQGLYRRGFLRTVIGATVRLTDRVIVPSVGTGEELIQRFLAPRHKVAVIPNGIDAAAVERAAAGEVTDCPPLAGRGERPVLCTVARLSPEKNLSLLLEAFGPVARATSAALIVLGDGPDRSALQRLAQSLGIGRQVFFLGERENVFPYVARADVAVHVCLYEGFGYTILEALACGTPVVAQDCPFGPREILGDSEFGVLVPTRDPQALSQALLRLLRDAAERRRLSELGRLRAKELSVREMAARYEAIFLGETPRAGEKR